MKSASKHTRSHQFRLYLLGSFRLESFVAGARAVDKAESISLPTRKIESLLAYLVLHPELHAREKLAALIWGDSTDEQARNSLRNALSVLRKQLEDDLLLVDRETAQLSPRFPLWVDAVEFKKQADALLASSTPSLDEVDLALYRGDLLADFYDDWILSEREQYRLLHLETLLRLTQTARAQSEYPRAIEYAQRILQNDVANERAHQHLMFAHLANGNRAAALKQYEECRRALETELAVAPMPETTALYQWIRQAAPEGKPLESKLTNLPIPVSSFIGRKRETAEVKTLLANHRLVTITGAGGSGKTRLAVQVATDLVDKYRDGVWWVELAPLVDELLVPQVVAKALGVHEVANQPLSDTLAHWVATRQMLLVLDNCEHVVAACARLAEKLLLASGNLVILATSREGLGIAGEVTWLVPLLSLPETQDWLRLFQDYEAIRLFVERAKAAKSEFELTEQNALAVAQICRRLDGIPLAIELAAARVKVLSPEDIAARLDDRFNLLTTGSRSALPRQQTLRALIDWSYDLLSLEEKTLFRRLAVFHGGRTLQAVEEVCSGDGIEKVQVLDLLARLIDKSLLLTDERYGVMLYRMLDTIRHYAHDKLKEAGETDQTRDAHLDYFLRFAETAEVKLRGAEQLLWLNRLEVEHNNLRAALEWARHNQDPIRREAAIRLPAALFRFWSLRGYWSEGTAWLAQAQKSSQVSSARASALIGLAELTELQDGPAASAPFYKEGLALFRALDDSWGIAFASCYALIVENDPGRAKALFDESLARARELGDQWLIANTYHRMGISAYRQGDFELTRASVEQALTYARETGDRWLISSALVNLGELARQQMDLSRAAAFYEEGLAIERELGDKEGSAITLHNLGYLAIHQRDYARAAQLFKESLTLHQGSGRKRGVVECLVGMGTVAAGLDQLERAALLLGVADAMLEDLKDALDPPDRAEYERTLASMRARMDRAPFESAWENGRELTEEQAIRLATSGED
jgi:predicted ATPase/DNA-binding SARP family transcriptional activator